MVKQSTNGLKKMVIHVKLCRFEYSSLVYYQKSIPKPMLRTNFRDVPKLKDKALLSV